jgi:hypothetical protein
MTLNPDAGLDLGDDLLDGATEIAEFLFADGSKRRRVYYLNEQGVLPLFYLGNTLCGRKSTLTKHVENAERATMAATAIINTTEAA